MRAIIVDDEDLARRGIRALLSHASDVTILAECNNVREAVEVVRRTQPDVVFLDVQMPEKSGFDFIETMGPNDCPYIIFVTAHDDFAIRAFDVHALDYLLKPLNERRFELALDRARQALVGARERGMGRRLAGLMADLGHPPGELASPAPDRIPVKSDGRVVIVRIVDVDWVKAEHDYVTLFVGEKTWLVRETISAIERRFSSAGFVRIHRSTLVNIERIQELHPLDKGEFRVVLRSGVHLKLSRNYRAALTCLAGATLR